MSARPLQGVRILDLTQLLPGPLATRVLLDMGAEVDKLEGPGGDPARHMGAPFFAALNAGKRSLVLDLKSEPGRAAFWALVPRYDVVVEQFRPGVMARLGVSPEAIRAAHPRAIVCSITGYGQTGELAAKAGHDLGYLARAGVLAMQGPADRAPVAPAMQVADVGGGQAAALAIVAALFAREKTGQGATLDIAMADAVAPFALAQLLSHGYFARGEAPLAGGLAVYNCYETSDGGHVALAALEPKFWQAFCRGAGLPEDDSPTRETLVALFKTKTRDEWATFGTQHDCCLEPVLAPDESPYAARWIEMSKSTNVPTLGEHTDQVLAEAGFTSR